MSESSTENRTEDATPVSEPADASLIEPGGDDNKPCEICGAPVPVDERHEILRAGGPVWRHDWHTESV